MPFCDPSRCLRCYVPVKVAQLLVEEPKAISAVVDSFLQRATSEMHALSRPVHFLPVDFVLCMVRFHRCSYARLRQEEFHPPKNYPLTDIPEPIAKAADLGVKVSCGVELLARKTYAGDENIAHRKSSESIRRVLEVHFCFHRLVDGLSVLGVPVVDFRDKVLGDASTVCRGRRRLDARWRKRPRAQSQGSGD